LIADNFRTAIFWRGFVKGINVFGLYTALIALFITGSAAICCAGEKQDITAEAIIRLTNQERAERSTPVLQTNKLLSQAAQRRLEDMLQKRYFAHTSPTGEDVADIADSLNYGYSRIGENLARGNFKSAADVVSFWLKSPQHRKNMLSRGYKDIGVAVARERVDGRDFWQAVQVFGSTVRPDLTR
jgi:uncharacterized protein YkwD